MTSVKRSRTKQFTMKLRSVSCYEHVEDHSSPARSSGKSMCVQGMCRIDRGVGLVWPDVDDQMHIMMQVEAARFQSLAWTTATS
mgnify:CR=1 FL=1